MRCVMWGRHWRRRGSFSPLESCRRTGSRTKGYVTVNVRAAAEDVYDREADAMGAERLKTRLPGDRSSDPHTDAGPDNADDSG